MSDTSVAERDPILSETSHRMTAHNLNLGLNKPTTILNISAKWSKITFLKLTNYEMGE